MLECRARATPKQISALLEFMEIHGDITRPQRGLQGRVQADRLWAKLAKMLNSMVGGISKPIDKWKKVWADWKTKTKKKALTMHSANNTSSNSKKTLTSFEQRVLAVMGISVVVGTPLVPTSPPDSSPVPSTTSPVPSAASPVPSASSPVPSDTSQREFTLRPRKLLEMTKTPTQTPLQQASSEFVAIEQRRLQLEELREAYNHEREMERLQIESKRILMEENRNEIFNRLATILANLTKVLPQLAPSQRF